MKRIMFALIAQARNKLIRWAIMGMGKINSEFGAF